MKFWKYNGIPFREYEVGDLLYYKDKLIEVIEVDDDMDDCLVESGENQFWLKSTQMDECKAV